MATTGSPTQTPSPSSTLQDLSATCTTAVPGKNGHVPIDACNSYYNYDPQFAPAVAVAVIFGMLTAIHIVQASWYKKRFCWVIIMGGLWETAAMVFRALGALDQQQIAYATVHAILFLLAPLWVNAFVYMTFARLVHYFMPEKRIGFVKASSLATYFVLVDIVAFIVQGVGASMATPGSDPNVIKTGINVYMGGIGLQQAFILIFICLMALFQRRAKMLEATEGIHREQKWRPLLYALYGALTAITVRIVYRIIEYGRGITTSNPVPFHEEYAYTLDAFPMMLAILALIIWHPGRTLVGPESSFPSRKEKKALGKARKAAKLQEKEEKKARRSGNRGEVEYMR